MSKTKGSGDDNPLWHCREERVTLDGAGRIKEMPESARRLLKHFFRIELKQGQQLPASVRDWLRRMSAIRSEALPKFELRNPRSPGEIATLSWLRDGPANSWLIVTVRTHVGLLLERNDLGLTPRETEVLRWVIAGKSNPEIGIILKSSPNTVRKHLERVYAKLGVENRMAAIRAVWENAQR